MPAPAPGRWTADPASVRPMLATVYDRPTEESLGQARWIYELKYDGMRVLVALDPAEPAPRVALWSRQGNDKTAQFPDVVRALQQFAKSLRRPVLLDGELVALDAHGEPLGFQHIAGRIHLTAEGDIASHAAGVPVAFVAFDILREGGEDLRPLSLVDRKARLERVFGNAASSLVRVSEMAAGDGRRLYQRARQLRGEGLVGKEAGSVYESGRRSPAWRKLKILRQQEFVVCGWTRPRHLRKHFGSLVLGYFEGTAPTPRLRFAGTAGSGFTDAELDRVWRLLGERLLDRCPFPSVPPTPEPAQWVRPELVAQVRFTEWTPDGVLRHPVYLGLRTDVDPHSVRREGRENIATTAAPAASKRTAAARRTSNTGARRRKASALDSHDLDAVVEQLQTLEDARRDGTLRLPDGSAFEVTNLAKVFWPGPTLTKGDLLRYYVRVSPWLLPILADRPLVMKRYPNGITGKAFYQQRAPDAVPAAVRVELVREDDETRPRLVGGSLATLLYMTQLAAISQDPWFSRLDARESPDYVALDLDPMPGVPFSHVLEVARAIRDELADLHVPAVAKTSGASGLHVYLPLAAGTPYAAGQLFCQIVATMIASRLPHIATVERAVSRRGRTVYIDYLQNIEGKTLACAYSARSSEFAGVSTPLAWHELDERIDPQDFTLPTVVDRFRTAGDLWAPVVSGPRLDLRDALERLQGRPGA